MIEKFRSLGKVLKIFNLRENRRLGFTLIEVLISLVLLGLGLTVSSRVFVAGKYFIKESENKTRAMEIASVHMNEYLTKSFDELNLGDSRTVGGFTSTATINPLTMSPPAGHLTKVNTVPYKSIEVICSYKEQNINGVVVDKSVRLLNMVVYPYMHLYSLATSPATAEARCYGTPCTTNANIAQAYTNATIIELPFETIVQSDLLIFYNISMNITNSAGIGASDLILTKCFITSESSGSPVGYDIQTGTPIMTQPTINNTVSVSNLPKGKHKLKIVWFADHKYGAGAIMGKKANVVIFQIEK